MKSGGEELRGDAAVKRLRRMSQECDPFVKRVIAERSQALAILRRAEKAEVESRTKKK